LHKIFLDILTFVNAVELKFGSLKVWNWIVQITKSSQNHVRSSTHHFQI